LQWSRPRFSWRARETVRGTTTTFVQSGRGELMNSSVLLRENWCRSTRQICCCCGERTFGARATHSSLSSTSVRVLRCGLRVLVCCQVTISGMKTYMGRRISIGVRCVSTWAARAGARWSDTRGFENGTCYLSVPLQILCGTNGESCYFPQSPHPSLLSSSQVAAVEFG
jgi:hypothetical protein